MREVEIPIANLPPALDGLRITQLSDIHVSYMPAAQRVVLPWPMELKGDLAVVTGDFVTGGRTRSKPASQLSACTRQLGYGAATGTMKFTRERRKPAKLFINLG